MIFSNTNLKIQDNSGVKLAQCIKIYKKSFFCKQAVLNDIIKITVKVLFKKTKKKNITKGSLFFAYITQLKKKTKKKTGFYINFDHNSAILLNTNFQPIGTRILGPISLKQRNIKNLKLISLASFII